MSDTSWYRYSTMAISIILLCTVAYNYSLIPCVKHVAWGSLFPWHHL